MTQFQNRKNTNNVHIVETNFTALMSLQRFYTSLYSYMTFLHDNNYTS